MSAFAETTRILYSSLTAGVHVRVGLHFGNARPFMFHAVVTFPLPFVLSASGNVGSMNQSTEPLVSDLQQGTRQHEGTAGRVSMVGQMAAIGGQVYIFAQAAVGRTLFVNGSNFGNQPSLSLWNGIGQLFFVANFLPPFMSASHASYCAFSSGEISRCGASRPKPSPSSPPSVPTWYASHHFLP